MFYRKLLFLLVYIVCVVRPNDINIGGMFGGNEDNEKAFTYAIEQANRNLEGKNMKALIEKESFENAQGPFNSMMKMCQLLNEGIVAMFGPKLQENIDIIQAMCDEKEIPHILTWKNYRSIRTGSILNFYPHPPMLSKAYTDIILSLEWKTFTILYEDDESFLSLIEVIRELEANNIIVNVRQLDKYQTGNYRPILKEVKSSGQTYFLIDCRIEHLPEVLLQMQQVGLMTGDYKLFITNLDTHTEDLTPFQYSETNITGIRIVNPDSEYVQKISSEMYAEDKSIMFMQSWKLKTESALIIDAVNMLSKAFMEINEESLAIGNIQCNSTESWAFGYSLINLVKTSTYNGLTGLINFNHEGFRSDFSLEIYELKEGGIPMIGTWNASSGINITRQGKIVDEDNLSSLHNRTFIVITALTDPYGMLKETHEVLVGNDRFEGYGIELIHQLSLMEGFNYTFIIREDKKNGKQDELTGKWSGMIGDLIEHRADLAITDLTITSDRAEAVDFTTPFMNLGISILFRKPGKAPPSFFSFADPFAIETWAALAMAYFVVSISLYAMGRLSVDEWTNPYPCIEEPEYLINQWSFANSFWFATGGLMQQGSEIAPIGLSTRMTAGVWWFFILIMVSSYTANLAAFLATENPINLFTDVASLVENAEKFKIRYGSKSGGATEIFFRESTNPLYKKIYQHMKEHSEDMPLENNYGVDLAEKEQYAFFMESTSINYVTQRHCDLQMYGNLLDDKGYGIAMRKNSPYRQQLSTAILKLQASGELDNLRRKWWEERRGGGQCESEGESADATPLGLQNVEGVFYVTIYGAICAVFIVMIEHLIYVIKVSRKTKISFKETFKLELKSYLNFESNVKPVLSREDSKEGSKSKSEEEGKSEKSTKSEKNPVPYGFNIPSKESPTKSNSNSTSKLFKSKNENSSHSS
ncbi:unnamed protein product [Brassicogethes aeneus]|uniref:Uncharacterized protein n=1 Tax=Brassicogethes aeneus TaxID=1431903 RepID=A0A9P0BA04_BRAAE|nr:unnamed protein product [Brassicogethes aeneus]